MSGRAYTIFDTAIGRCGIAWGDAGIVGVQLPEAREIETRKRLFRLYPDARETRPPANVELAIEGIVTLLRGEGSDFSNVTIDMSGIHGFYQRVYQITRAIARNPFVIIVPCHRVREADGHAEKMSPHGGTISKRRLLSIEGVGNPSS